MRRTIILTGILLCLAAGALAKKPPSIKDAQKLLEASRAVVNLQDQGPYRMEISLHVVDENQKQLDGTYKVDWAAPDRFREEITLGDFQQTRVVAGGNEWLKRNQDYAPLRVAELANLVPNSPHFGQIGLKIVTEMRELNTPLTSETTLCITGDFGGLLNTFCADEKTAEPVYIESVPLEDTPKARVVFSGYAPFGKGRQIPRSIEYGLGGATVIRLTVTKLDAVAPEDVDHNNAFAPLEGITAKPSCLPFTNAAGPGLASGIGGVGNAAEYFIAAGVIGTDGKMRDVKVRHAVDPARESAMEKYLTAAKYEPAVCRGNAVEQEALVAFDASAIGMITAPRAGAGGYGDVTCTYCPDPIYPINEARRETQGFVLLQCLVSAEGRITHIKILKGLSRKLDENAVDTVQTWKLIPAEGPDGKPAMVVVNVQVQFRLRP
jgi:TonB family protein